METKPTPDPACQGPRDNTLPLVGEPTETPRITLADAIFSEDLEQCRELLDIYPELINARLQHPSYKQVQPLDWAWWRTGDGFRDPLPPIVFASLIPRYQEREVDSRVLSPTSLAIIALFVERGAVLKISPREDHWVSGLLMEVCRDYDSPEALELLVRIGANIHTRRLDDFHHNLLQVAAGRGAVDTVGFLLDRGVPMNYAYGDYRDRAGDGPGDGTPLHWAAKGARSRVVRLLLNRGALPDIKAVDKNGRTPLHCAAQGLARERDDIFPLPDLLDREETIRILVDAGADLTALDGHYSPNSPLGNVASWGSAGIVRYMASKGSNINQHGSKHLQNKSNPYYVGGDKVTPLHMAAYTWNAAAIQALLDLGADPNAADEYGRQPLHWAAIGRYFFGTVLDDWNDLQTDPHKRPALSARLTALESTISHLLTHKVNVNQTDIHDRTPLHYAAYMKHARAVALLLQSGGADPSIPDPDGRTTLHLLAEPLYTRHCSGLSDTAIEDPRLTRALTTWLQHNANSTILDQRDNTGATALHIAARCASAPAVALLLSLGADPNLVFTPQPKTGETDEEGAGTTTALHLAASPPRWVQFWTHGEEEYAAWKLRAARIKELLLAAGADAGVRDSKGWTAGEVEAVVWEGIRMGREKYLEWLARPPPPPPPQGYGRGWGRGSGRGQWSERDIGTRRRVLGRELPSASRDGDEYVPGPMTGNGGSDMAAGAGHGRGSGEPAARASGSGTYQPTDV